MSGMCAVIVSMGRKTPGYRPNSLASSIPYTTNPYTMSTIQATKAPIATLFMFIGAPSSNVNGSRRMRGFYAVCEADGTFCGTWLERRVPAPLSNRRDRRFQLLELCVAAFFQLAAAPIGVERGDLALD